MHNERGNKMKVTRNGRVADSTARRGSGSEIYLNSFFVFKYYRLSPIILNTLNERQKKELRGNL